MYIGYAGGIEERAVPALAIPLVRLKLTTPDSPLSTFRAAVDLARATAACVRTLCKFSPDILLSTGGFVSAPATLAAWFLRRPIVILLPDVAPGKSVKLLCRTARRVAVPVEDSRDLLPDPERVSVTGYPVRPAFLSTKRTLARASMGLTNGDLQVLVMGGSLGATAINRSLALGLGRLLPLARVLHICGSAHVSEMTAVQSQLPETLRSRYRVTPYLDEEEMAVAMFASDLAITRGGASILGELPAAGLPAIIVPLPAARVGQAANAAALERHNACLIVSNHHAESGELITTAEHLLVNHDVRQSMARAVSSLFRPRAAADVAEILLQTAAPDG